MADEDTAEQAVDIGGITAQVLAEAAKYVSLDSLTDATVSAALKSLVAKAKALEHLLQELAELGGKTLAAVEQPILPVFATFIAPIVANMFGADYPVELFASRGEVAGRKHGAEGVVQAYLSALEGDTPTPLEPSDEGAHRIATGAVHAAVEGWFNAWILEMLGDLVPWEWLKFKDAAKLPEELIRALGVGRLVRRAVSPIVDVAAATPLKWKMNLKYRPELLSPAQVVRQLARGRWDWQDGLDELGKQGYDDTRIDALINEQLKFLSVDDLAWLSWVGQISHDDATNSMRDQGWDEQTASKHLLIQGMRRLDTIRRDSIAPAIGAYVDRRIESADVQQWIADAVDNEQERAQLKHSADVKRLLNTKVLSPAQVAACVKRDILSVDDYRNALRRDGYGEDDVLSLELLLRDELATQQSIDEHRAAALAAREAEQKARADATAKRLADVEAERALQRRGKVSDLTRAVAHGLIPIARLQEVLAAEYDADTVAILVQLAEQQRQAYLARQKAATDTTRAAARRNVSTSELDAAVLAGILTLDEYKTRLTGLGFAPADVELLAAVVADKKADKDAAEQLRRDANVKAAAKHIDLTRFEQLVRRGARSLADYDAFLQTLGFDEVSRAAMQELLSLKIADDKRAATTRDTAAGKVDSKGVSLEQMRRAVLLGLRTVDDYSAYLVQNGFDGDAQQILLGELRDDVTVADAARARREQAPVDRAKPTITLAELARAARLGVIPIDTYQAALVAAGYSDDDIAIEVALLQTEIADVQSAHATQAAADATQPNSTLTLAQLERAVKAGVATLDDYRARALAGGMSADDADTLTRVLADELAAGRAARARRDALAGKTTPAGVSIGVLTSQVQDGSLTLDDYRSQLAAAGLSTVDVDLLASLV